ncbi:Protein phosphatase 1, regulatory subunit, and related proteins [Ceraceosorus bombacis]|uniref:Protein phosphatase 1, regulatory subunit, and related proteins n=1 Tax=Ceraceosorus bombacis TaxID=401625 RepID=A0A0P1BIH8_9BASI|nr:Protein phosphatase 1, regulatory subunit, and related proteins [Ceraceosorus bombacis]
MQKRESYTRSDDPFFEPDDDVGEAEPNGPQDSSSSSDSDLAEGEASGEPKVTQAATSNSSPQVEPNASTSIFERTSLSLSSNPLPSTRDLSRTLRRFSALRKLEMTRMQASAASPNGLESLHWLQEATIGATTKSAGSEEEHAFGQELTSFDVSGNERLGVKGGRDALNGIERLTALRVLNLTSCSLAHVPFHLLPRALHALILAQNNLEAISMLPHFPSLNTLILSANRLAKLPANLASSLPALKKINLSGNNISGNQLPDFTSCSALKEVNLRGNPLEQLPAHMANWGLGGAAKARKLQSAASCLERSTDGDGVRILDLSDCRLEDWASIEPLLHVTSGASAAALKTAEAGQQRAESGKASKRLKYRGLASLSLRGNGVTRMPGYRERMIKSVPTLRQLDGTLIEERKPSRQRKEASPPLEKSSTGTKHEHRRDSGWASRSETNARSAAEIDDEPSDLEGSEEEALAQEAARDRARVRRPPTESKPEALTRTESKSRSTASEQTKKRKREERERPRPSSAGENVPQKPRNGPGPRAKNPAFEDQRREGRTHKRGARGKKRKSSADEVSQELAGKNDKNGVDASQKRKPRRVVEVIHAESERGVTSRSRKAPVEVMEEGVQSDASSDDDRPTRKHKAHKRASDVKEVLRSAAGLDEEREAEAHEYFPHASSPAKARGKQEKATMNERQQISGNARAKGKPAHIDPKVRDNRSPKSSNKSKGSGASASALEAHDRPNKPLPNRHAASKTDARMAKRKLSAWDADSPLVNRKQSSAVLQAEHESGVADKKDQGKERTSVKGVVDLRKKSKGNKPLPTLPAAGKELGAARYTQQKASLPSSSQTDDMWGSGAGSGWW